MISKTENLKLHIQDLERNIMILDNHINESAKSIEEWKKERAQMELEKQECIQELNNKLDT